MPSTPVTRAAVGGVAVLSLTAGLVAATLLPGRAPQAVAAPALTPYDGCPVLLRHYRAELRRSASPYGVGAGLRFAWTGAEGAGVLMAAPMPDGAPARTAAVGASGTGTNTQEADVDEPDTAKIADGLLVTLVRGRLHLVRAGSRPELLSVTTVSKDLYGGELLLDGDRVVVLIPGSRQDRPTPSGGAPARRIAPSWGGRPTTTLVLFDVADPRHPRRLESYEVDGQYLSARLADGRVRLVTRHYPTLRGVSPVAPYGRAEESRALARNRRIAGQAGVADVLPQATHRDALGRVVSRGTALGCTDVQRAREPRGAATLVVTTLVPGRGLAPTHTTGVTTDGDLVYASTERLYVATSRWGTAGPVGQFGWWSGASAPAASPAASRPARDLVTTEIHAFATGESERTDYVGSGSVPGYVLGRWALSFHEGHLRVATTRQPPWETGKAGAPVRVAATSSSVVVLAEQDGRLVPTGRVDGLGRGERIYAVRYLGDLATVVTFRQTDPLYVLDLSDPRAPRVRGALKIPGFSTYLHPVGDDRLLGVGHDADSSGRVTGVQLSLFDLSNRAAPRQLARLSLGDGYSEALSESRAFGYDVARGLALLPFSTWRSPDDAHVALGVTVTADGRLVELGRLAAGRPYPVSRVLHDDDHVYAVSDSGIVAGAAGTMRPTGSVRFALPPDVVEKR